MNFNLPPDLQEKMTAAWARLGPALEVTGKTLNAVLTAGRVPTVGETFRHLCVVGLNKSELLLAGERNPVYSDSWQDLADDNLKRGLGMMFFAPRTLEGEPVNPYLFLAEEGKLSGPSSNDDDDDADMSMAQQVVKGMGLLDMCRMTPSEPNMLNMVLAADVLFHWDVRDNYVLPTTQLGWMRDVEQVLKGYPRTTKATIYTAWETDLMAPDARITLKHLRDLPLDDRVWLNKPTFQEKYGTYILALSLMLATGTWLMLHLQNRTIDDINEQLRVVEQQIPTQGNVTLARAVTEQEKYLERRDIFFLTVKDTARAINASEMKFANFEVRQPDPQTTPSEYVVTIEAEKDAYEGWLQEEPVAKDILMNSALMVAVRKPPANTFKLEGLVPLNLIWKEYKKLAKERAKAPPKTEESGESEL